MSTTTDPRLELLTRLEERDKMLDPARSYLRVPREEIKAALSVVEDYRQGRFWPGVVAGSPEERAP